MIYSNTFILTSFVLCCKVWVILEKNKIKNPDQKSEVLQLNCCCYGHTDVEQPLRRRRLQQIVLGGAYGIKSIYLCCVCVITVFARRGRQKFCIAGFRFAAMFECTVVH